MGLRGWLVDRGGEMGDELRFLGIELELMDGWIGFFFDGLGTVWLQRLL